MAAAVQRRALTRPKGGGGPAVALAQLGKGVARAARPLPPLPEAMQRDIMDRHLARDALDQPVPAPHAQAKVGLLAGDEVLGIAARLDERADAEHGVAPTGLSPAHGNVPLIVAHHVVSARLRVALASTAENNRQLRVPHERFGRRVDPAGHHFAVAIDHLNEGEVRVPLKQGGQSGVAGARRGERGRIAELHDGEAETSGQRHAAIGRARVDVHALLAERLDGPQAAAKALAFVPADHDDPQSVASFHRRHL